MTVQFNCLAITGGIGSGKSTILKLFEEKGYTVFNADQLAHQLLHSSSPFFQDYTKKIDEWLGTNYQSMIEIKREDFREQLIKAENGFQIIGKIAIPYVLKSMQNVYLTYKEQQIPLVFEVPLLLEGKLDPYFSEILVVTAQLDIRKKRIRERDPFLTEQNIIDRINIQTTDEQKISVANFVIDNSGTTQELKTKFELFYSDWLSNKNNAILTKSICKKY